MYFCVGKTKVQLGFLFVNRKTTIWDGTTNFSGWGAVQAWIVSCFVRYVFGRSREPCTGCSPRFGDATAVPTQMDC